MLLCMRCVMVVVYMLLSSVLILVLVLVVVDDEYFPFEDSSLLSNPSVMDYVEHKNDFMQLVDQVSQAKKKK